MLSVYDPFPVTRDVTFARYAWLFKEFQKLSWENPMFVPVMAVPLKFTFALALGFVEFVGPCQKSKESVTLPVMPETLRVPAPTSRNPISAVTKFVLNMVSAKEIVFALAGAQTARANASTPIKRQFWALIHVVLDRINDLLLLPAVSKVHGIGEKRIRISP